MFKYFAYIFGFSIREFKGEHTYNMVTLNSEVIKFDLPIVARNHGDGNIITKEFLKIWDEVPSTLSEIKLQTLLGLLYVDILWDEFASKVKSKLNNFYSMEDFISGRIPQSVLDNLHPKGEEFYLKTGSFE